MAHNGRIVVVIGAGSTGAATAHDLALRGCKVVVVERGEIGSGTTGRCHCVLHSGGRYCVRDHEAAVECIQENMILRRIMPDGLELNDGLFVALSDADLAYKEPFLTACAACGIPYEELTREQALALEPNLNPGLLAAVRVPDGTFEAFRFCLRLLATAMRNGAEVHPYTEVVELLSDGRGTIRGVRVRDRLRNRIYQIESDMVVNATGAWASDVAAMAGISVPVNPTPGVMVSMDMRVCNMVINRLNKPADGDIVLPQRRTSIIGTTSWPVEHADYIPVPQDHVRLMLEKGAELLPVLRRAHMNGAFAVARPLIGAAGTSGRELSRTFECFDHTRDSVHGFVTITGGKMTTARAMAEKTADVVCRALGVTAPCLTRETVLASSREFYAQATS
ncbi:MAG TPA: FAD-dependent oxidoreductase [bacterium]|nr:FAD-dependent oxidoreductase [bacterium]